MAEPRPSPGPAPRHAVVTGAASGIGAAIAARLLAAGWRVTGLDRAAPAALPEGLDLRRLDLTDGAATRAMAARLQGADALVHAAGMLRVGRLGEDDGDDGAAMWRLHVEAASVLAGVLAPAMAAGGRILLIGSRTAQGAAGRAQYAASKAALVALARSWAAELAGRGITANVIAPAATDTPMLRDPARAGLAPRLPPIGRFVQPEEVAALAAFLLSAEAAAITGQQIVICGGASL
ncbi:MAG: SDR family oxidoreductase [Rhodospirillales bacterium]|nr:SDR family oxidoreductase [Rhodospirillales bacterium]